MLYREVSGNDYGMEPSSCSYISLSSSPSFFFKVALVALVCMNPNSTVLSQLTVEWSGAPRPTPAFAATVLRIDDQGNTYVGGTDTANPRNYYAVAAKYGPMGALLWSFSYNPNPNSHTYTQTLSVDSTGNTLIAAGGSQTYIVAKLGKHSSWTQEYALGTNRYGSPFTVVGDTRGGVYVGGYVLAESQDFLLLSYDSSGRLVWHQQPDGGNGSEDICTHLLVDSADHVYMLGSSRESRISSHYTVIKYSKAGQELWRRTHSAPELPLAQYGAYIGSAFFDIHTNLCVCGAHGIIKYDPNGQLVWRELESAMNGKPGTDGSLTVNIRPATPMADDSSMLHRYDSSGRLQWRSVVPSSMSGGFVESDANGNTYMAGGGYPVNLVAKYDANGSRLWTNPLPTSVSFLRGMQADSTGSLYVVGQYGPPVKLRQPETGAAPTFLATPTAQQVAAGSPCVFTTEAQGHAPLRYQWFFNGQPIVGATASTLTLPTVKQADAGLYSVSVATDSGVIYSSAVPLTLDQPNAARLPVQLTTLSGEPIRLRAAATGADPLSYAWVRNGKRFRRTSTNEILDQPHEDTQYSVIVTNRYGMTTSVVANVTVLPKRPLQEWKHRGDVSIWNLTAVIYTENLFVAVGGSDLGDVTSGVILTSTNGIDWVERLNKAPYYFTSIAHGNGVYVAASGLKFLSGGPASWFGSMVSTDAVHWTEGARVDTPLTAVGFLGGKFFACSYWATYVSTNGRNWSNEVAHREATRATFVGSDQRALFVRAAYDGANDGNVITSSDGLGWDVPKFSGGTLGTIEGAAYGNGKFLILSGQPSEVVQVFTSSDGLTFSASSTLTNHHLGLSYGNGTWVAVGAGGVLSASTDGRTWERLFPQPLPKLQAVTFGAGTFVAVGTGTILQSGNVESTIVTAKRSAASQGSPGHALVIEGKVGRDYTIDLSNDLQQWSPYLVLRSDQPLVRVTLTNSPPKDTTFYRVRAK